MKKRKITAVKLLAGIGGLVIVFLLGGLVSGLLYDFLEKTSPQGDMPATATAKPALTQEQQEERYRAIKEAMGEETPQETKTGQDQAKPGEGQSRDVIDFSYLETINPDIYAWITIPGTNIDYPVLQHPTDDSYYLHHNLDGSYGYPACIYTESLNAKDFSDPNTVIYGHNMRSTGTMFAQLHKFADKDFFEKNNQIILSLPQRELHYQVFAAYAYDDRHLLYSFDFQDKGVFEAYLESVYDIREMGANIDSDRKATAEDHIITLVTCMMDRNDTEHRFLVQAVLTEELFQ